jgi:cystathionine beta-lyase
LSDAELAKFFDGMDLFKLGYSWGGYESLILYFDPTKIRTATKWSAAGSAIRLSIGLEDVNDLIADLGAALKRI